MTLALKVSAADVAEDIARDLARVRLPLSTAAAIRQCVAMWLRQAGYDVRESFPLVRGLICDLAISIRDAGDSPTPAGSERLVAIVIEKRASFGTGAALAELFCCSPDVAAAVAITGGTGSGRHEGNGKPVFSVGIGQAWTRRTGLERTAS